MGQCMILPGDLHRLLAELCPDRVAAECDQEVTRHAVLAEALATSLVSRLILLEDHLQTNQVAELCLGNLGNLDGLGGL